MLKRTLRFLLDAWLLTDRTVPGGKAATALILPPAGQLYTPDPRSRMNDRGGGLFSLQSGPGCAIMPKTVDQFGKGGGPYGYTVPGLSKQHRQSGMLHP